MVNCKLVIVPLIGVFEVCTANSISSKEESNTEKLFTEDELERAIRVGLSEQYLISGKSKGFTLDEMIKLRELGKPKSAVDRLFTFEFMAKASDILIPGHKMTANYSSDQADELENVIQNVMPFLTPKQELPFFRTKLCAYVSEPNLNAFGPKFVSLMKIRFRRNEDFKLLDDVSTAELMCCVDEGGDNIHNVRTTELRDEELKEFNELWNGFDAMDVPKSIKKLCDFLHAKNLANRCLKPSVLAFDNAGQQIPS